MQLVTSDYLISVCIRYRSWLWSLRPSSQSTAAAYVQPLLHQTNKSTLLWCLVEGTQPIILEDGTTAYISHEPPTPHDNLSLDQDSLNILDTLPPVTEAEVGCKRHILTWYCMMLCSFGLTFKEHFTHMCIEVDLAGTSAKFITANCEKLLCITRPFSLTKISMLYMYYA